MRFRALLLAVLFLPSAALAEGRLLRLVGEAPTAGEPAPKAFVIDATIGPGESEAVTSVSGWLAATVAPAASGEISGSCVESHCALTADLDGTKFTLTGEFGAGAGPFAARFQVKDPDGKSTGSGEATVRPLAGDAPGLGALAAPGAITQAQLDELLVWAHASVSSGSPPGEDPPSGFQRESLAAWQNEKGRLATGLIFAADLAQLAADRDAARKACGWTVLTPGPGWRAGYPAALLPAASRGPGSAQRFASADGKAAIEIGFDPAMSDADFDALVKKVGDDRPGRDQVSLTRVNGDMEIRYREGGVITVAAWHSRENGLARLAFTYPDAAADLYSPFDAILTHALAESP